MNIEQLKEQIVSHMKSRSEYTSLLRLVAATFENMAESNKNVTVDQVVRGLIDKNNQCLELRSKASEEQKVSLDRLEHENNFLKSLLPSYMSVDELRKELQPLGLDSSGASIGKAIKYLRSNGLEFLPADVKIALE